MNRDDFDVSFGFSSTGMYLTSIKYIKMKAVK